MQPVQSATAHISPKSNQVVVSIQSTVPIDINLRLVHAMSHYSGMTWMAVLSNVNQSSPLSIIILLITLLDSSRSMKRKWIRLVMIVSSPCSILPPLSLIMSSMQTLFEHSRAPIPKLFLLTDRGKRGVICLHSILISSTQRACEYMVPLLHVGLYLWHV